MTAIQQKYKTQKAVDIQLKIEVNKVTAEYSAENDFNIEVGSVTYNCCYFSIGSVNYSSYAWNSKPEKRDACAMPSPESLTNEEIIALYRNGEDSSGVAKEFHVWLKDNIYLGYE